MPPNHPLATNPKPHQAAALARYAGSEWAFFAMEMRLGKTLTFLWWCLNAAAHRDGPHLIVAPLCTFASWLRDLERLGEDPLILAQKDWARDPEALAEAVENHYDCGGRFYLVNWEGLLDVGNKTRRGKPQAVPTAVAQFPWMTVGLDESTKIKNPQALTTKVVLGHLSDAPRRACLSGLPAPESQLDLVNQMLFLQGRWLGVRNWWEAREKFYTKIGFEWVPDRGSVPAIKEAWKNDAFIATRAALGLETKPIRTLRTCVLAPDARRVYDGIEKHWAWSDEWAKHRMQLSVWLAGIASGWPANRTESWHHKTDLLCEMLNGDYEPELKREQIVIWCGPFRREVEAVASAIYFLVGEKPGVLVGGMKLEDRIKLERDFQAGKFRILVGMAAAGRYGMDLSCASVQIRFSYLWSYEVHQQSEERTEAMSKKTPTLMINMVTEDTVDEDVVEALADKRLNARTFTHLIYEKFQARLAKRKEIARATGH